MNENSFLSTSDRLHIALGGVKFPSPQWIRSPYDVDTRKEHPVSSRGDRGYIRPIGRGIDGDLLGIVANYRDISAQKQAEAALHEAKVQLKELATTDGLTQLLNRRRLDECLGMEWRRLARKKLPLSFIICDVDCFKKYNDRYGHQSGDECLRAVAAAIRSRAKRPADLVARYGGEEFAVVLPNTGLDGAHSVANAIREAVQHLCIAHEASEVSPWVSLSLGVATRVPDERFSAERLMAAAERALYDAKHNGRNQVALAGGA